MHSSIQCSNSTQGIWFIAAQPLGFVLYLIAAVAEVNRAPFDLPEAEQELTAGYLTEYSGLRWSLYQMAEYINMITVSAVASTLFLGGWSFFGFGLERIPGVSIIIFMIKVALFLFFFIWLRATLPRIRYDRLMRLGWQTLLPLAVLNIIVTAIVVAFGLPWWINGIVGLAVVIGLLFYIQRSSVTEGTRFTGTTLDKHDGKGTTKAILPTSVRLAKFEKVSAPVVIEAEPTNDVAQIEVAKA